MAVQSVEEESEKPTLKYDTLRECIESRNHREATDDEGECILCGCSTRYEHNGLRECLENDDHCTHMDEHGDCLMCGEADLPRYPTLKRCLLSADHRDYLDSDGDCAQCSSSKEYLYESAEHCYSEGEHLDTTNSSGECFLCGSSDDISDVEEEETSEEEEEENVSPSGLWPAVVACLNLEQSLKVKCGGGTVLHGRLVQEKDRALAAATCEETAVINILLSADDDGYLYHKASGEALRCHDQIVKVRTRINDEVLGRTIAMMMRRLHGESPVDESTPYEDRVWRTMNESPYVYSGTQRGSFLDCYVRLTIHCSNGDYNYEHIWVLVDGTWTPTDENDKDELSGICCSSTVAADVKYGSKLTFKVSEITDVYREKFTSAHKSRLYAAGVETLLDYGQRPYNKDMVNAVWSVMSDQERLHVTRSASFINRRSTRKD